MSRQPPDDRRERVKMPERRVALLTARDLVLAGLAAPALPGFAAAAERESQSPAPYCVMHGFADHQGMLLWIQGPRAHRLVVDVMEGSASAKALLSIEAELDPR